MSSMYGLIAAFLKRLIFRRETIIDLEHRTDTFQNFKYGSRVIFNSGKFRGQRGTIIRPRTVRMKKLFVRLDAGDSTWALPSQIDLIPTTESSHYGI